MKRGQQLLPVLAVLFLLVGQIGPAVAVASSGAAVPSSNQSTRDGGARGVDSAAEVEAFVDAAMAEDMDEHHVSGATVSVVKDGELLFAEGYGYADRRNATPVVANRTMFRIGSVSKLFAWTAAMQQVQRGRLDPNASVNRYLGEVQIPRKYGEPVTLEHLATHTAGFEDQYEGVFVESPADVRPLGETLRNVPARVRPPGVVTSYSNYGAALAGHIVARRADTSFDSYVERNLYEPLDMTQSTFRQPVPASMPGRLSAGYRYERGRFVRGEFETVGVPPAGSMSATSTDMANFMVAHLQDGRYRDSRVLSAAATERMHRQHFTNHPAVDGMAFGFYEQDRNGVRIIGHGGDTELFHSGLWLFPERDLGVFVSYNSVGGAAAREEFIGSFVDRFFPTDSEPAASPVAADGGSDIADPPLSAFTGAYRTTRMSYTDFTKIAAVNGDFRVRAADDGTLVASLPGQGTSRWVRTAPTVFEEVGGEGRMAFRVEDGRATYVFFDGAAPQSFERIAPWETTMVQAGLLAGALLVVLSGLAGWPAAALWRRVRRWRRRRRVASEGTAVSANGRGTGSDRPRAARWLAGLAGLHAVGFLVGFVALLATDPNSIVFRPGSLGSLLTVPLVFAVTALGVVAFAVLAWTDRYWGLFGRLHYTLVALALVALLWQFSYWNMLSYWF
ncbi:MULTISPECIES: serine hydrolase [Halorussus]|uniref:serine hydrolase domain-containing protein n=1 Tax=Halorussus TaxID=1070314 RepID=UPI000E20CB42|nr:MULTISPECIES: serine hydrolase domain-containing protein [Halorussus]NHN59297.1 beta-lactamase family protein [Halorussus sp. JP-T4]